MMASRHSNGSPNRTSKYLNRSLVRSIAWPVALCIVCGLAILGLLAAERRILPTSGLDARYLAQGGASAEVRHLARDPVVTTRLVRGRVASMPPGPLTVEWRGFLTLVRPGSYDIGATAAGSVEIYIDGRLVVPQPAPNEGGRVRRATVSLSPGSHGLLVRYETRTRPPAIDLLWAESGRPLEAMAPSLLSTRPRRPPSALLAEWLPRLFRAAALLFTASFAWAVLVAPSRALGRALGAMRAVTSADRLFPSIIALCVLLDLVGLWWGLPDRRGWAPDEIVPENVLTALRAWFAGGWHEIYPALPFAVIGALALPLFGLAAWLGWPLDGVAASTLVFVAARLLSVAASAGTAWMAYLAAAELAGRRAGRIAAALVALAPPAVYYAKLANVDAASLFWVMAAFYFFVRAEREPDADACLLFASAATVAVCTKDQAYGYFLLPAAWLAWRHRAAWSRWSVDPGARSGLSARTVAVACVTAAGLFALGHNLWFNWAGFVRHLSLITGEASQPYRMWPVSMPGQARMAAETGRQLAWILGWPVFAAAPLALLALARQRRLRLAGIALLPVVSYYLCFIEVVGYLYDRFLLGPAYLVAIVVAAGFAQPIPAGVRTRRWLAAASLLVGLHLLARAASVDVMMVTDSRYAAERWLAQHAREGAVTAGVGLPESLPRYSRHPYVRLQPHPDALARLSPDLVVFDAGHLARYAEGRPERSLLEGLVSGRAGYRRVASLDRRPRWLPLPWEGPLAGPVESLFTNLDKVSPRIEIYARGLQGGAAPSR